MPGRKLILDLKGSGILFKTVLAIILTLLIISLLSACAAPAVTTQTPVSSSPAASSQSPTSVVSTTPTTTPAAAKPQGELTAAYLTFGNENFLPWLDPVAAPLDDLVYDMLTYYDHLNETFIPGLAESWELSSDARTLTYHLRKGIQFQEGWGEFTSADVKYNFEMQASPKSVGKVSQTRRIASMDTPDPYTLVIHFKDSYPTFWVELSTGNSGICQGIVSKKYVETVGEEAASQKPIGTGPYKVVNSQLGSYYKFEALDSHWRVVPEFKTLTVRLITEISTMVAALKNKEVDLVANIPVEQLADLKASGLGVEISPLGGNTLMFRLGGMVVPEDKRYDAAYHNKDPWADSKVRKAMTMAIDRRAICDAIFSGFATPAGLPLYSKDMDKYQYPYDPAAAKQLLKEAGYPDGFTFNVISYTFIGVPETPRIIEAAAGYWQQIGLDPKITVINYNTYNSRNIVPCKTAGDVSMVGMLPQADILSRAEMSLLPNAVSVVYQDAGSYAIYKDSPKASLEERNACMAKLNQYYFENVGPIPLCKTGYCFSWNKDKVLPWPHHESPAPVYLEYARHSQPLNTFRLFTPWPER